MPEITITLVDHTANSSDKLRVLIQQHLADMFEDLLFSPSEPTVVNTRWALAPAPADQDLVLHFVDDIPHSYVAMKMPGAAITPIDGGFTRTQGGRTGSEFYKSPTIGGIATRLTATGYAKLAAHEAIHNMTGMTNAQLHGRGGLASSPPLLPVVADNRTIVQAALGHIPNQLL